MYILKKIQKVINIIELVQLELQLDVLKIQMLKVSGKIAKGMMKDSLFYLTLLSNKKQKFMMIQKKNWENVINFILFQAKNQEPEKFYIING